MPEGIQYDCTPVKLAVLLHSAMLIMFARHNLLAPFCSPTSGIRDTWKYIYIYIFIIIWNQELSKNGESRRKKAWTMEESVS